MWCKRARIFGGLYLHRELWKDGEKKEKNKHANCAAIWCNKLWWRRVSTSIYSTLEVIKEIFIDVLHDPVPCVCESLPAPSWALQPRLAELRAKPTWTGGTSEGKAMQLNTEKQNKGIVSVHLNVSPRVVGLHQDWVTLVYALVYTYALA